MFCNQVNLKMDDIGDQYGSQQAEHYGLKHNLQNELHPFSNTHCIIARIVVGRLLRSTMDCGLKPSVKPTLLGSNHSVDRLG